MPTNPVPTKTTFITFAFKLATPPLLFHLKSLFRLIVYVVNVLAATTCHQIQSRHGLHHKKVCCPIAHIGKELLDFEPRKRFRQRIVLECTLSPRWVRCTFAMDLEVLRWMADNQVLSAAQSDYPMLPADRQDSHKPL